MAIIHNTTMRPGKLALLTAWLPGQPWYRQTGRRPELAKAGGFRLDDPQGEVGIEFMVVTDGSGPGATAYQIPLTYRASALAGAGRALIGTSEHGVLGARWICDGVHDPVLLAQLVALIQGEAEPQAQDISNTADPTVTGQPVAGGSLALASFAVTGDGPSGTDIRLETTGADAEPGQLTVRVNRVLRPAEDHEAHRDAGPPCLYASWRAGDGTHIRGVFASGRYSMI
jgi:hypothetical protein